MDAPGDKERVFGDAHLRDKQTLQAKRAELRGASAQDVIRLSDDGNHRFGHLVNRLEMDLRRKCSHPDIQRKERVFISNKGQRPLQEVVLGGTGVFLGGVEQRACNSFGFKVLGRRQIYGDGSSARWAAWNEGVTAWAGLD